MEFALVLDAVGISCAVQPGEDRFALVVRAQDADRAREQLRLYRHEHRATSPPFESRLDIYDGLVSACLYGVTILLFDILQRNQAFSLDWWHAGMSQAGLIRDGAWWRAVTALALHADTLHLAGNLVFGLLFGFLAGGVLGWGLAVSGMLLAGALGNALNAFVQAPGHTSVGASTAVFAAVGILAAYAWKRRRIRINRWVPLGGGVALLAFLGMSGERTDILAHIAGFGSGCLFGLVFGALETRALLAAWHRHALGLAACLFFALAWSLALRAGG
ncbi:MAG: rhomboid family intramembrane serine protease [Alphaproteobacteria bacterium]|nr:rhomboid family intramembrane serine protease [Alphaproteobacteria bacterium]